MSERDGRVGDFSSANELPDAVKEVLENPSIDLAIVHDAVDVSVLVNKTPTDTFKVLADILPYGKTDTVVHDWHRANTALEPYGYVLEGRKSEGEFGRGRLSFIRHDRSPLHFDSPLLDPDSEIVHGTGPVVLSTRVDRNYGVKKLFYSRRLPEAVDAFDFRSKEYPRGLSIEDSVLVGRGRRIPQILELLAGEDVLRRVEQGPGDILITPGFPLAALHGAALQRTHGDRDTVSSAIEPYWFTQ